MAAYIPTYSDVLGADWNCRRLYRLWQNTLKSAYYWGTARNLKKTWHYKMHAICLAHAIEQEKTLVVWVQKYKPSENWVNEPTPL